MFIQENVYVISNTTRWDLLSQRSISLVEATTSVIVSLQLILKIISMFLPVGTHQLLIPQRQVPVKGAPLFSLEKHGEVNYEGLPLREHNTRL